MNLTSTEVEPVRRLEKAQAFVTDLLVSSRRCNSFCDMVIKMDMTTPTAHGLDQAEDRHPSNGGTVASLTGPTVALLNRMYPEHPHVAARLRCRALHKVKLSSAVSSDI